MNYLLKIKMGNLNLNRSFSFSNIKLYNRCEDITHFTQTIKVIQGNIR